MRKRIQAIRRSDNGFTLTELLITIVILGVLAGIVVFAVGAFSDDGKLVACQTDKKNVEIAVDAYYAKNNHYPNDPAENKRFDALTTAPGQYLKARPDSAHGYTISLDDKGGVTSGMKDC